MKRLGRASIGKVRKNKRIAVLVCVCARRTGIRSRVAVCGTPRCACADELTVGWMFSFVVARSFVLSWRCFALFTFFRQARSPREV